MTVAVAAILVSVNVNDRYFAGEQIKVTNEVVAGWFAQVGVPDVDERDLSVHLDGWNVINTSTPVSYRP